MRLWVTASEIADEGRTRGAQRVAYLTEDGFVFSAVDEGAAARVLEQHQPRRYKFQASAEGRWENLGGYRNAFETEALRTTLRVADYERLLTIDRSDLARAADQEPRRIARSLAALEVRMVSLLHPSIDPESVTEMHRALAEVGPFLGDAGEFLLAQLDLYVEAARAGLYGAIEMADPAGVSAAVMDLAHRSGQKWESGPRRAALELMLGKLAGLVDREKASVHFGEAIEHGADQLGDAFVYDRGATTYFSATEIDSTPDSVTREVVDAVASASVWTPTNRLGVLVSVDERFFRIYSSMLYHLAQQVPDIDLVFLMCGDPATTRSLVGEGEAYQQALAGLNRSGIPENVHYTHAEVPPWVAEQTTFYACARFYAVQAMLERYPQVYLMDADLSVKTDPTAFFQRIESLPFAVPENRSLLGFWPWRRYGAGNVALTRDVLSTGLLEDVQRYLTHGLSRTRSWTLDQNALAFAIERHGDVARSLNDYERPFGQIRFRSTWERTFNAANPRGGA